MSTPLGDPRMEVGICGGEAVTTAELVRTLLRRWYLTAAGALLTCAVLWVAVQQAPVYFSQVDVVLVPPAEARLTNTLRDGPYLLAPLAGLVVADLNEGADVPVTATADTTLYGEGVEEGDRVRLRNRGTQWRPVYDTGVIDVQVVGADPDGVRQRVLDLVAGLDDVLVARQVDAAVPPDLRVTLESSPSAPVVQQVGPSRSRAAGSIAALGAVLTFLAVVALDRIVARRTRTSRAGERVHEQESDREPEREPEQEVVMS
jgi:hypothetical protein